MFISFSNVYVVEERRNDHIMYHVSHIFYGTLLSSLYTSCYGGLPSCVVLTFETAHSVSVIPISRTWNQPTLMSIPLVLQRWRTLVPISGHSGLAVVAVPCSPTLPGLALLHTCLRILIWRSTAPHTRPPRAPGGTVGRCVPVAWRFLRYGWAVTPPYGMHQRRCRVTCCGVPTRVAGGGRHRQQTAW